MFLIWNVIIITLHLVQCVNHCQNSETTSKHSSSRIQSLLFILLFSSAHRFRPGQGCPKLILWLLNRFYVGLDVCFGSQSCRNIQPQPSFSCLADFHFKFPGRLVQIQRCPDVNLLKSMMSCILTRSPGHLVGNSP